ncbi:hypothetical protein [Geobacter sp. AOG2]|uniref:hypothetical protein n=1 Tax=Geobacter sp. AOG2 TaxID=1566347 RepID=UPI001CC7EBF6|nr:hypothetical protein [Geobacter sp. AOG2]GFE61704.1 hypothetical protein AOG2_22910 [Geobacter sp. AOG2]
MFEFAYKDVFMLTLLALLFTFVVIVLTYLMKHMQRQNKELINTMRDSYEKQIYMINDNLTASMDRWRDVNHLLLSSQAVQPAVDPSQKVRFSSFLKANGVRSEEIDPDPNLVFVLTPFNNRFDNVFETIRNTCLDVGLKCYRGDEEFIQGDILQHILKVICKASIIIANIEGRNPNVFYELGLAHAMDKSTLLISKTVDALPIDIKSKKIIVYQESNDLKSKLKDELLKLAYIKKNNNKQINKNNYQNNLEVTGDKYFTGKVYYELENASNAAQQQTKPLFIVIYDNNKMTRSKLDHSLGYFLEYETTKDLVNNNFIQVLGEAADPNFSKLVPEDDPLENCLLVIMSPNGYILRREGVYANPDEGLKRVRESIKSWTEAYKINTEFN